MHAEGKGRAGRGRKARDSAFVNSGRACRSLLTWAGPRECPGVVQEQESHCIIIQCMWSALFARKPAPQRLHAVAGDDHPLAAAPLCPPSSADAKPVDDVGSVRGRCQALLARECGPAREAMTTLVPMLVRKARDAEASYHATCIDVSAELTALVAAEVSAVRALAALIAKDAEAAAEACTVTSEQLEACAVLCDEAVASGHPLDADTLALITNLLGGAAAPPPSSFVAIIASRPHCAHEVDALARVRAGVDPGACVVTGSGLKGYLRGDSEAAATHNVLRVAVVDYEGEGVDTVEEGDVSVCVQGGEVTRTSLLSLSHFKVEVGYLVPAPEDAPWEPITLCVAVFGHPVGGSPLSIPYSLNSVLLPLVDADIRATFMTTLTSEWLPGRAFSLLYRGSRDGMTPVAFHRRCDGKGPTLVLVRSDNGYTFGGYAGKSWESHESGASIRCPDAFVFCVEGPHCSVVRFPVEPSNAGHAMGAGNDYGPWFPGGMVITAGEGPAAVFDRKSRCTIGVFYRDVLGRGKATFTNDINFAPKDIEVFACV